MQDTKTVKTDYGITSEAKTGLAKALKGKNVKVGKVEPTSITPVSAFVGLKKVEK